MTYNIGTIIGPMLGGVLCDPASSYPDLFGHNAFFLKFPYAVPNCSVLFFSSPPPWLSGWVSKR